MGQSVGFELSINEFSVQLLPRELEITVFKEKQPLWVFNGWEFLFGEKVISLFATDDQCASELYGIEGYPCVEYVRTPGLRCSCYRRLLWFQRWLTHEEDVELVKLTLNDHSFFDDAWFCIPAKSTQKDLLTFVEIVLEENEAIKHTQESEFNA